MQMFGEFVRSEPTNSFCAGKSAFVTHRPSTALIFQARCNPQESLAESIWRHTNPVVDYYNAALLWIFEMMPLDYDLRRIGVVRVFDQFDQGGGFTPDEQLPKL